MAMQAGSELSGGLGQDESPGSVNEFNRHSIGFTIRFMICLQTCLDSFYQNRISTQPACCRLDTREHGIEIFIVGVHVERGQWRMELPVGDSIQDGNFLVFPIFGSLGKDLDFATIWF